MTTANDSGLNPPVATADAPSANGASTLRDRVRSLRLSHGSSDAHGAARAAVLLPWGVCLILLGVCAAFGYYAYVVAPSRAAADLQAHAGDQPSQDGQTPSAPAESADVASSGEVVTAGKGYVTPVHQIQVTPMVAGPLIKVSPRLMEGEYVKKGEFLAQVDPSIYQAQVDQRAAARGSALAALNQAQTQLHVAEDTLARDVAAPVATTQQQTVQDRDARDVSEAALKAAQANVNVAEANLHEAQVNLGYCTIVAPVDGCILAKNAELGNVVNPVAFNISSSLCNMADLSDLEVEVKVQERDVAKVIKGMPCMAMPEAYQSDPEFLKNHPKGYTGRVSRKMPSADRSQGAIPVRVRLDIPADEVGVYLKPDMSVDVRFLKP